MKMIHFALLGCGHIGKRHAAIINKHPQGVLAALIDVKNYNELNIEQYNAPFFTTLESFLSSNIKADIVNIATPNGLHSEHAIACLQSGKHVVIEKPMALTTHDAKCIIEAAEQSNKEIFIVKQNRYSPPVAWLKEIITNKVLGEIFNVQLNCFWNRDERYYTHKNNDWHGSKALDGGSLFTQFSHFIDIFYWLFGDIKNIYATMQSYNHQQLTEFEDSGIVTFEFGNNSIGCLNFSTAVWDNNFESSITIIAANGSIKIGGQYMDKIEYCHIKNYAMPQLAASNNAHNYGTYSGSAANHSFVIQNVIDVLNDKSSITANAKEGMAVVNIIERMYATANKVL